MILDSLLEFADAVALDTGGTGKAAVGDVIDLQGDNTPAGIQDLGNGHPMYLVIQVDTAVDSTGDAATVSFELVSDSVTTPAADGTETVHLKTEDIAEATLVAGYTRVFTVPVEADQAYERYLGIQQNVGTEAVTAGAINAFLTFDPYGWKAYPDADN